MTSILLALLRYLSVAAETIKENYGLKVLQFGRLCVLSWLGGVAGAMIAVAFVGREVVIHAFLLGGAVAAFWVLLNFLNQGIA